MRKKIVFWISVLFLVCLVYLAFFNRYQTDDYILAASVIKQGNFDSFLETYLHWSGRYFSFFLAKNTTLIFHDYEIYPTIAPIFSILLLVFGFFLVLKSYLGGFFKINIQKAIVLSAVYFWLCVSLGEHLYWNSAAKIYFFPMLYFLYFLYFLKRWQERGEGYVYGLLYLLSFMIIGSNEMMAVQFCVVLFLFYQKIKNQKLLFLLLASLFFLIFSFLAPGNRERLSGQELLFVQKLQSIVKLFGGLLIFSIIKSMVLIPIVHCYFKRELGYLIHHKLIFRIGVISISGLAIAGVLGAGDARSTDTFLFFVFLFLAGFIFRYRNLGRWFFLSIVLVLVPHFYLPPHRNHFFDLNYHGFDVYHDITSGKLSVFKTQMKERESILEQSSAQEMVLKRISYVPRTLYFVEIPDKQHWDYINVQLCDYYQKKFIVTESSKK